MIETYGMRDQVLKEMGFENYMAYLASPLWAKIRRGVYETMGDKCFVCQQSAQIVHHMSYIREVLLGKHIKPLYPLCCRCHDGVELNPDGTKRNFDAVQRAFNRIIEWKTRGHEKKKRKGKKK